MSNTFYNKSSNPRFKSSLNSSLIVNEFASIEEGFSAIPQFITSVNSGVIASLGSMFKVGGESVDLAMLNGSVTIVKTDDSADVVTISDSTTGATIMGMSSYELFAQNESVGLVLYDNGSTRNWIVGQTDTTHTYFGVDDGVYQYDLAGASNNDSIMIAKVYGGTTPLTIIDSTPGNTIMGESNYLLYVYLESVSLLLNVNNWVVI